MNFIYPQFLFALFAVTVPVIIHLFNFRRFRKIYFSDIRFLKEVKLQTRNRNRLKHLLILAVRILAICFLVFAFAQPFIPGKGKKSVTGSRSAVSVFVDNSFSMENLGKNGMLLDEAKKIAGEIAMAYDQSDRFQLLTNDFEGKHQRLVSREEFLALLDEVKESPAVKKISEVILRQSEVLNKAETKNKRSFLISDFQRSISDFGNIREDTDVKTMLVPVEANRQNNLYIDSCWFEIPVHRINMPEIVHVRVKNISENKLENIPLKLFLDNEQKTPSSFSIEPNGTRDIQLSFTMKEPGIRHGRIELSDYPVVYDDKFYFSFSVDKYIAVTCISAVSPSLPAVSGTLPISADDPPEKSGRKAVQSLFGNDSLFILTDSDENKIDYASLSSQQVIILSELKTISSGLAQQLDRFVQNGGSLIVFPSMEADTASYKAFLISLGANYYLMKDTASTKIDHVNVESQVFSDVFEKQTAFAGKKAENTDLPVVHTHFRQSHSNRTNEEILMRLKNGDSFFSKYTYKKGKVYLSSVPLNPEWSNLTRHAIFVPLLYKIAINSQPYTDLFYTLGQNNSIPLVSLQAEDRSKTGDEKIFKIKGDELSPLTKNFEVIPETRVIDLQPTIFVHDQIKNAGNYSLCLGNESLSGLSFNYDRKESDLRQFSADEVMTACAKAGLVSFSSVDISNKNVSVALADIYLGKRYWKWCIVIALVLLAAESLLLRFWK
jgi:Aerotolerance regulator N-terminal